MLLRRPVRGVGLSTVLLSVLLSSSSASAMELTWEGYYRARGLLYNSLSLSDSNKYAEGTSNSFDHRLLLKPNWLLTPNAAVHAQIDVLPLVMWGDQPDVYTDPVTGETIATAQADGVAVANPGLAAVRAWGEGKFDIRGVPVRVAMGRMPLQWGAGALWNSGDDVSGEFGDSADRIQVDTRFGPVFAMAAWDMQFEGFLGVPDDMESASLALGYRSETIGVGFLNNYRYQPSNNYSAYTGDLWGFTQLGPVFAEVEAVGVFGSGNLDNGANNITISSMGVMVRGGYQTEKLGVTGEFGVAAGDEDPTDSKLTTFHFDRDHNVSLMMFEEPLPTLESQVLNDTNGGRTTDAAVTGEGISNAIYFNPRVSYRFLPKFQGELSWLGALQAKPVTDSKGGGYGNEFDLSLRVDPVPHVWAQGTVGVMLPGGYYRDATDPDLGSGFDHYALGARLMGVVEF